MRVYNSFIATLAITFTVITAVMIAYSVDKLDAYFALYSIALLVLTTLYVSFSPKARQALSMVSMVAFAGFTVVVAFKVVEILYGE